MFTFNFIYESVIVRVTPPILIFNPVSVFDSNQTSPSLGALGAGPTSSFIRALADVDAPMCKLAVGTGTLIPILPVVWPEILGEPPLFAYVPLPNNTPPMFIPFAVELGNDMFVPIMILFEPIFVPPATLYPNKLEYDALLAPYQLDTQ